MSVNLCVIYCFAFDVWGRVNVGVALSLIQCQSAWCVRVNCIHSRAWSGHFVNLYFEMQNFFGGKKGFLKC